MRVIGTAGHVDHGKSTLILALTGIDPDRLKEEKEREMTIDLGFAWLTLPGGEQVGIVDVPGHIDFIKNMLAGVGGIDAALLVIAVDEGPMPQTREHLAILDLLQVSAGVVALTKVDLLDMLGGEEWLELVIADVEELLADTRLAEAPIVPVSGRTGQGLQELLQALEQVLRFAPLRHDREQPRLPIDRAFTIAGFGTVVTGTLSDGVFHVGDEVEIVPGELRARIRGLETHKHKIEAAVPGSRVAINLSGVRQDQLARGMVVALPGTIRPTTMVDAQLRVLTDAPRPLRHNQLVDFFSGAAETQAHLRLLDAETLPPGGEGWVQLRLSKPVALIPGDRFIIRQPSPSRTLGGGAVINPHPRRRWRRFHPDVIKQLETLAHGTPTEILFQTLERIEPTPANELVHRSGLTNQSVVPALAELIETDRLHVLDSNFNTGDGDFAALAASTRYLISHRGWQHLIERIQAILKAYHRNFPLRGGMHREELKSRLQPRGGWPGKVFNEIITRAVAAGILVEQDTLVALPTHRVTFTPEQEQRIEKLLRTFQSSPYAPPSVGDAITVVGEDVLQALIEQGTLVKVSEDVLFLQETYAEMVERVRAHLGQYESITVAEVRDMFRTSRKYALALMEYLDDQRITRRVGDERILRARDAQSSS
ncbi:MAG TPA: selenocysteine-specific translation elongation factor [Anaerolineae bacterium]|nr:selenocysteine-specific translation elongation factor [Anaerolineae bacterium]